MCNEFNFHGLEIIIQLCRLQVQREREKLKMTPKMGAALTALKQLQSFVDDEADKVVKRIHNTTMPLVKSGFEAAHGAIDGAHSAVGDIEDFAKQLFTSNGGETPLGNSGGTSVQPQAGQTEEPRSSEVASK